MIKSKYSHWATRGICFWLLLDISVCLTLAISHNGSVEHNQQVVVPAQSRAKDPSINIDHLKAMRSLQSEDVTIASNMQKCSPRSMLLARQTIVRELELMNNFNSIWFNDLDRDEIMAEQKESLGNIVMSGTVDQLMTNDRRPLFEIEASYFKPLNVNHWPGNLPEHNKTIATMAHSSAPPTASGNQPIAIKLIRKFHDRCYLEESKGQFTYILGLAVGPIEHNLDVIVNLNRDLSLTQPIDWRYAQIKLIVPRMNYEITLKQVASSKLNSILENSGCPLEVLDIIYSNKSQLAISALGLASTNQTMLQLERLFNDYTKPAITSRLHQVLKFHLNSKTLPLSVSD